MEPRPKAAWPVILGTAIVVLGFFAQPLGLLPDKPYKFWLRLVPVAAATCVLFAVGISFYREKARIRRKKRVLYTASKKSTASYDQLARSYDALEESGWRGDVPPK